MIEYNGTQSLSQDLFILAIGHNFRKEDFLQMA